MNCSKCKEKCTQATAGPGVPEGQYWCNQCCAEINLKVPRVFLWDGDANRQRWMEEQRAKKAARDAFRVDYFLKNGEWPVKEVA